MLDAIAAHSLAEAYLYLLATPCVHCGQGPLMGGDANRTPSADIPRPDNPGADGVASTVTILATCKACARREGFSFSVETGIDASEPDALRVVNPTPNPSTILDVAQWITLFRVLTQAAASQSDKQECRRLGLEAAQCLDEAIKFYDDPDNDLPPSEAFFLDASRERRQSHPEMFSRQRLIDLRAKLPSTATMLKSIRDGGREKPRKRRWWRFWK